MPKKNSFQIGEIEVPLNYFSMSEEDKRTLCLGLFETMIDVINHTTKKEYNRFDILDKLLESTIQTNLEAENYEVVAVLTDIQKILNE